MRYLIRRIVKRKSGFEFQQVVETNFPVTVGSKGPSGDVLSCEVLKPSIVE